MTPAQILALIDLAGGLLGVIDHHITAARERGEWTEEQDRAFAEKLKAAALAPHWKPKSTPTT